MKATKKVLTAALLVLGAAAAARADGNMITNDAVQVVSTDKLNLGFFGRAQMVGVFEQVPDPIRDHSRVYLFLKQARLGARGRYGDLTYESQLAFGGEDANGSNTDLSLLDFSAEIPVKPLAGALVKVGQFRVPFGREGLADRGYLLWQDRSIANMATYQSRDYGVALSKYSGAFAGTLATFSSGGRDVPQRYLPEKLGFPEVVARIGYNDGVDEDIYHVVGTDDNLKRTTKAAYLSGLYVKDTLIGHSTAINVRTIDKNLLINPNYNPYIGTGPTGAAGTATTLSRATIWMVGGDAVIRHPLSEGHAVEVEAEADYGHFSNDYGSLNVTTARLQGDYQFQPFTVGVRYAALFLDPRMGYQKTSAPVSFFSGGLGQAIHEVTPSVTWKEKSSNLRITAELPLLINVPVFTEAGVGSYLFNEQPDQINLIANPANTLTRRTIPEAKLLFQFMF